MHIEYIKENLSLTSRSAFAIFALLVVVFGGTLQLIIAGNYVIVPILNISFIDLGLLTSVGLVVVLFWLMRRSLKLLSEIKELATEQGAI